MSNIIRNFKLFEDSYDNVQSKNELDFSEDDIEHLDKEEQDINVESESDSYEGLIGAVNDLLDKSKQENSESLDDIKRKIEKEGIDSATIQNFTNENDIYDFYLENKFDVDSKLNDIEFFNDAPSKYNSTGLYDYVIIGTKVAVESVILNM